MGLNQAVLDKILQSNAGASSDAISEAMKRFQANKIQGVVGQQALDQGQQTNEAKLNELITGKKADSDNEIRRQDHAEELRKAHVAEALPRLQEMMKAYPNMAPAFDETGNVSLHPIDTVDKELKRRQMNALSEDRQDRMKSRETNNLQNYYSSQGGKNYSQKAAVLQRAKELLAKGDPESLRSAELELSQGQAANALTQQEYNALTSAHGAGNIMQTGAKNLANVVQNIVPTSLGGDKLSNWLGQRAANMKTMTPAEIQQKMDVAQHLIDQNRSSADAIRGELQQRAPQLAPSMSRHDPRGLDTVINTLGARIPGPDSQPQTPGRQSPQQAGPRPGDVEDGHRFKGGNPADPNNWEQM